MKVYFFVLMDYDKICCNIKIFINIYKDIEMVWELLCVFNLFIWIKYGGVDVNIKFLFLWYFDSWKD